MNQEAQLLSIIEILEDSSIRDKYWHMRGYC
jgi:hypothetical protein